MKLLRTSSWVFPGRSRGCLHGARSGLVERREKDKGGARGCGHDAGRGREEARRQRVVHPPVRIGQAATQRRDARAHRRGGRSRPPGLRRDRDRQRSGRPRDSVQARGCLRTRPPLEDGKLCVGRMNDHAPKLLASIERWADMRRRLESGEISRSEYEAWRSRVE